MKNLHINSQRCQTLLTINDELLSTYTPSPIFNCDIFFFQNDGSKEIITLAIECGFHIDGKTFPIFFTPNISALEIRDSQQGVSLNNTVNR